MAAETGSVTAVQATVDVGRRTGTTDVGEQVEQRTHDSSGEAAITSGGNLLGITASESASLQTITPLWREPDVRVQKPPAAPSTVVNEGSAQKQLEEPSAAGDMHRKDGVDDEALVPRVTADHPVDVAEQDSHLVLERKASEGDHEQKDDGAATSKETDHASTAAATVSSAEAVASMQPLASSESLQAFGQPDAPEHAPGLPISAKEAATPAESQPHTEIAKEHVDNLPSSGVVSPNSAGEEAPLAKSETNAGTGGESIGTVSSSGIACDIPVEEIAHPDLSSCEKPSKQDAAASEQPNPQTEEEPALVTQLDERTQKDEDCKADVQAGGPITVEQRVAMLRAKLLEKRAQHGPFVVVAASVTSADAAVGAASCSTAADADAGATLSFTDRPSAAACDVGEQAADNGEGADGGAGVVEQFLDSKRSALDALAKRLGKRRRKAESAREAAPGGTHGHLEAAAEKRSMSRSASRALADFMSKSRRGADEAPEKKAADKTKSSTKKKKKKQNKEHDSQREPSDASKGDQTRLLGSSRKEKNKEEKNKKKQKQSKNKKEKKTKGGKTKKEASKKTCDSDADVREGRSEASPTQDGDDAISEAEEEDTPPAATAGGGSEECGVGAGSGAHAEEGEVEDGEVEEGELSSPGEDNRSVKKKAKKKDKKTKTSHDNSKDKKKLNTKDEKMKARKDEETMARSKSKSPSRKVAESPQKKARKDAKNRKDAKERPKEKERDGSDTSRDKKKGDAKASKHSTKDRSQEKGRARERTKSRSRGNEQKRSRSRPRRSKRRRSRSKSRPRRSRPKSRQRSRSKRSRRPRSRSRRARSRSKSPIRPRSRSRSRLRPRSRSRRRSESRGKSRKKRSPKSRGRRRSSSQSRGRRTSPGHARKVSGEAVAPPPEVAEAIKSFSKIRLINLVANKDLNGLCGIVLPSGVSKAEDIPGTAKVRLETGREVAVRLANMEPLTKTTNISKEQENRLRVMHDEIESEVKANCGGGR